MYEKHSNHRILTDKETAQYKREGRDEELVELNMRLVFKAAAKLGVGRIQHKIPVEDIIQEGIKGLIVAIKRYNPDLPSPLRVYAYKSSIGMMKNIIKKSYNKKHPTMFLEEVYADSDGDSHSFEEFLSDESSPSTNVICELNDGVNNICDIINNTNILTDVERNCIMYRFGFYDEGCGTPLGTTETSRRMNISAERVGVVTKHAVSKLRSYLAIVG